MKYSIQQITHFVLILFCCPLLYALRTQEEYYVQTKNIYCVSPADTFVSQCFRPLTFTRSGIRVFFRDIFSNELYAQEFLPHSFFHLIEFLEYCKDCNQGDSSATIAYAALRLFMNKTKGCRTIADEAILTILERLPDLLEPQLKKKSVNVFDSMKSSLKRTLYTMFLSKFSNFKEEPDIFFDELVDSIIKDIDGSSWVKMHIETEQLRQTVVRFIDLTLNKIIWTPLDQEASWSNVKLVANKLEELMKHGVINTDELDDFFQSLIERYIMFLDLAGSDLNQTTLDCIQQDINEKTILLLTLQEQEEFIEPKIARLQKAIDKARPKSIARAHGIVADYVVA